MVLEDLPPSPTDFTTDYSSPTSDSDPYADSLEEPLISINLAQLPSAAPLFGPLFGYTNQFLAAAIHHRVQQTSAFLQRPVSEDEASALAYWTARMLAIASWGRPVGLAGGAWRAYETRDSFRFPFFKPAPERFNPNVIKIANFELLRGGLAPFVWHGLRGGAYGIIGSFVGGIIVSTYAATAAAVGEQQDPRLRELIAKMRVKAKEIAAGMPRARERAQRGDPTGQGETQASELWKNHRRAIEGDDASPTAGNTDGFDDGTDVDEGRLAMSDAGVLSDQQLSGQEVRPQSRPRRPPPSPRSFDAPDYDDASPTAGAGGGGSAWERIRKEAGSNPNPGRRRRAVPRQPQQQEQQEGGEGFTVDSEGPERAEAQRVFDEQVERERRGGEFGAREKGW